MIKRIVYLSYFVLGFGLFWFYLYRINPDGISYFTVAQNYANGYFVINGFWSPLLSWLLIPFYLLRISPFTGFNLIQLCVGFFTLLGIEKLTDFFPQAKERKVLVLAAAIPFILYCAYSVITPDLLSFCLLLYYCNSVLKAKTQGFQAGLFGALAYLAKTYAFYFFLAHFTLMMIAKRDWRNFLKGFGVFFVIAGVWVALQSLQYHQLTVGNTGKYNYETCRPGGVNKPFLYDGLLKPPPHAQSAWYDPSIMSILYHKPPTLAAEIVGWVSVIFHNMLEQGYQYEGFSLFAVLILGYAMYQIKNPQYRFLLATFVLYSLGYLIYHVEDRYIWFPVALLLLMAANIKIRNVFMIVLFVSFVVIPSKRLLWNLNESKDIYLLGTVVHLSGNVASNGDYNNSLFLSYYSNARYFGIPTGTASVMEKSIQNNHITYFLSWSDAPFDAFTKRYKKIQQKGGVTIYHVQ